MNLLLSIRRLFADLFRSSKKLDFRCSILLNIDSCRYILKTRISRELQRTKRSERSKRKALVVKKVNCFQMPALRWR